MLSLLKNMIIGVELLEYIDDLDENFSHVAYVFFFLQGARCKSGRHVPVQSDPTAIHWHHTCCPWQLLRHQAARDHCVSGQDYRALATRSQHRKGLHSPDCGDIRCGQGTDAIQTHWRNYKVNK